MRDRKPPTKDCNWHTHHQSQASYVSTKGLLQYNSKRLHASWEWKTSTHQCWGLLEIKMISLILSLIFSLFTQIMNAFMIQIDILQYYNVLSSRQVDQYDLQNIIYLKNVFPTKEKQQDDQTASQEKIKGTKARKPKYFSSFKVNTIVRTFSV